MKDCLEIKFNNLTNEERESFLKLIEKSQNNSKTYRKRWRGSKDNNIYYTITSSGELTDVLEEDTPYDDKCYQFGNYFKNAEEAIFARNRQLVYQQLKDYALEHNTEEIDWTNNYLSKFCITYDYQNINLFIDGMQTVKYPNTVYFTSEKIAKDAIREIGENKIKYYLFGIGN